MFEPRGFTLIEAMVVVAVGAILLSVALPRYSHALQKARRTEAIAALDALQQAQERWRADHPAYADASAWAQLGAGVTDANRVTTSGMYLLDIEAASAEGYVATASARLAQSGDDPCRLLRVTQVSFGATVYSSVDAAGRESTGVPNRCWGR